MRFHLAAILAPIAAALIGGCNDDPGSIGSAYLPQNVTFGSVTIPAERFTITGGIASVGNGSGLGAPRLLVGRADDGTVAHGLLAITTSSPLLEDGVPRPVTQSVLRLPTGAYAFGDTTTPRASFDVVVLDRLFSVDEQWTEDLRAAIAAAPLLGSIDVAYPTSGRLEVQLDVEKTATFLKEYYRWDTTSAPGAAVERSFRTLKTLALRAHDDASTVVALNGVVGIADSLRPSLRVTLGDTTVALPIGATSWIVTSPADTSPSGRLSVAAGVPVRTLVTFPLDSIPPTATIHQAELVFHADAEGSRHGTRGLPSELYAYVAADSSLKSTSYLQSSIGFVRANRLASSSQTAPTYRITTLATLLNQWLRFERGDSARGLRNNGLILAYPRVSGTGGYESETVDRLRFHGPQATDPSLRPSLTIIYSTQTDVR